MSKFYELKLYAFFATHEEAGEQEVGGHFFQHLPTKESIAKAIDRADLKEDQKEELRKLFGACESFEVGCGNTIELNEYDTLSFQLVEHEFED